MTPEEMKDHLERLWKPKQRHASYYELVARGNDYVRRFRS